MKKRYRMNDELPSIDYSARCTFITDPTMKLQRCGLPKSIVLRLFRPLIVRRMLDAGLADEKEDAEEGRDGGFARWKEDESVRSYAHRTRDGGQDSSTRSAERERERKKRERERE